MFLFDHLGAFYFWCYKVAINKIKGKEIPTMKDILSGKGMYNEGDIVDLGAYGLKLKFIGAVITGVIIHLLTKF